MKYRTEADLKPRERLCVKVLGLLIMLVSLAVAVNSVSGEIRLDLAFPNLQFIRPVDLQHSGDSTNRLFVVQQRGVISVFDNDLSVNNATVFLDIGARVSDIGDEEGLLGLAFHLDYANNGFFFVNYTAANPRRTVIARYSVSVADPDMADKDSELVILEVNQPFSNHNGGQLRFGSDGYLYIGMGDGGDAGDPFGNGQDLTTLLGAMLRIDVDTPMGGLNYGIPPDNPFVGNPSGFREEIYAYGLRNPWRFSFDSDTDQLWLADVGQNLFEEVDIIESGQNYGWKVMEGLHCFSPPVGCDMTGLTLPIWEYDHSLGRAITGGFVYRGSKVPELIGAYIYADYITGRIWSLRYDGVTADNTQLIDTNLNIASFGVDENSELYICAFDGNIYTITSTVAAGITAAPNPVQVGQSLDVLLTLNNTGNAFTATLALFGQAGGSPRLLISGAGVPISAGFNVVDFPIFSVPDVPSGLPPTVTLIFSIFDESTRNLVASDTEIVGIVGGAAMTENSGPEENVSAFLEALTLSQAIQMQPVQLEYLAAPALRKRPPQAAPMRNELGVAFPSIANPETWIPYQLATPASVTIEIYNAQGNLVRQLAFGDQTAGFYRSRSRAAYWDGTTSDGERVASGVYFYRLRAGDFSATRKMLIVR